MTTPVPGSKVVTHLGVPLSLASIIGQRITLQGEFPASGLDPLTGLPTSTPGQRSHVDWLPDGKPASEVEFRAQMVTSNAQFGTTPIVRYAVELSHGEYTWQEPVHIPNFQGVIAVHPGYVIPGRGVSIRLPARQMRIWLWIEGTLSSNPAPPPSRHIVPWVPTQYPSGAPAPAGTPPQVEVVSSFEPVIGMARPIYPTQDVLAYPLRVTNPVGPVVAVPMATILPITANEFRIRDNEGRVFAAGVNFISFQGLNGFGSALRDASTLGDFSPIPWFAALMYTSTQVAQVDYR
jgi:hypothetical protein